MQRLFVDEIISVGAVPEGDDPEALITFYKSKESQHMANDDGKEIDVEFDLSALDDEIRKSVTEHVASLEARITELEAMSEPTEDSGDILKNAPDEVRELVAKQQQQIAELAETLDNQVAKQRTEEFVAKAASFEDLLGKADEVAPVLLKIADAAPAEWATLDGWLTALAQREDLGEVFKEYGHGETGAADPVARRDAYVAKQREHGDRRPVDQIRAEFWAENRDAVAALREEQ